MTNNLSALIICLLFFILMPSTLRALTSDEVLVVYNGDNFDSVKLAEYYQQTRNIPEENMCHVICASSETISREDYEEKIQSKIEAYLKEKNIRNKILCMVLIYGVPLKISSSQIANINKENRELGALIRDKQQFINTENEIQKLQAQIDTNNKKIQQIKQRDTGASVDSELCLIFNDHELSKWTANPYFFFNDKKFKPFSNKFSMYMVARLDGPDPKYVTHMIDSAIRAEKTGLRGNVYIDARSAGDKKDKGSTTAMDALLIEAGNIAKQAGFKTIVEKTGRLFAKNECPDTALYFGWYSLQKYIDSFTFVPGAVAIHIASCECMSLRHDKLWCPQLIAHGVTATAGPVAEPYLSSFPNPVIFIMSFLNGYSLAESYFLSTPFLSWKMVLIGDPLYAPFKKKISSHIQD